MKSRGAGYRRAMLPTDSAATRRHADSEVSGAHRRHRRSCRPRGELGVRIGRTRSAGQVDRHEDTVTDDRR